ncbi:tetratricopeptide repeat protein [Fibrobacterota bacterium]
MSSKKSKRRKKKSGGAIQSTLTDSFQLSEGPGPVFRVWPNAEKRSQVISSVQSIPAADRDPQQLYVLGTLLVYQGGIDSNIGLVEEGIASLEAAAEAEPLLPEAVLELAWLSTFLDSRSVEIKRAEKAVELFPDEADAWKFKALMHYRLGQKELSLECLRKACGLPGSSAEDRANLSRLEKGEKMSEGAGCLFPVPDFGSLHFPPSEPEEKLLFNLFILKNCLAHEGDNPDLLFEAVLHCFFLHKLDEAKSFAIRLQERSGTHPDGLALLGFLHEKKKDMDRAVALYRQVLGKDPHHPFANTNLARHMLSFGAIFLAEHFLEKALQAAPDYPEALHLYGRILSYREDSGERSLDCHRRAIQMEPEVPDYHLHYCLSALQVGSLDKLKGEWSFHKKYIQTFSESGAVRRLLNMALSGAKEPVQDIAIAEMLIQNGFTSSARLFIQRAWKKVYLVDEKKQTEFLYYTGVQASRCDELEISLEAYRRLAEKEGSGGAASTFMALTLNRLGRHEEALKTIQACRMHDSRVLTIAANIHWSLDQYDEALESIREAAEKPDSQFLAHYYGIKYAVQRNRGDMLGAFINAGKKKWPDSFQFLVLHAEALMALERAEEAVNVLRYQLFCDGKPVRSLKNKAGAGPVVDVNLYEPYFLLGCALMRTGGQDDFQGLLGWLNERFPDISGKWEVLRAENLRGQGKYQNALECITKTNVHPLTRLTRALCYKSQQRWDSAEALVNGLVHEKEQDSLMYHPAGNIKATAYGIASEIHLNRGEMEKAESAARTAIKLEPANLLAKQVAESVIKA